MLALSLIEGVGPILGKQLISHFETAENVFRESDTALRKLKRVGPSIVAAKKNSWVLKRADQEIDFARKHAIDILCFQEDNYPFLLSNCSDSPLILFKKGEGVLKEGKSVSIVGTRKASVQGKAFCEALIEGVSSLDVSVHSGLAYGIDIAAHRAAIRHGLPTYATLAHGLDRIYPSEHRKVANEMLEKGGWISEFLSGTKPDRENFPKRNRLVAGLTQATIVVESAKSGGSLITAKLANSYNRDVFAVPGKTTDEFAKGCHYLIKTDQAHLLESAEDLLYKMNWQINPEPKQMKLFEGLTPIQQKLVAVLKLGRQSIDVLSEQLKTPISEVSTILLMLEFDGVVRQLPGKFYELKH